MPAPAMLPQSRGPNLQLSLALAFCRGYFEHNLDISNQSTLVDIAVRVLGFSEAEIRACLGSEEWARLVEVLSIEARTRLQQARPNAEKPARFMVTHSIGSQRKACNGHGICFGGRRQWTWDEWLPQARRSTCQSPFFATKDSFGASKRSSLVTLKVDFRVNQAGSLEPKSAMAGAGICTNLTTWPTPPRRAKLSRSCDFVQLTPK
ncbi:uncharacterized protein B0I36DRAFT_351495 [Microdochium trichocladiopsis]|uniref:Uncharacterized protein n=1 Tax=Microdochium trichocladiopsis TaxID=1682393 RepID=A0A9P9BLG5_9PEZI|nr:uncharacterized protein B0I36DRAFT_351495 [Microdochium trichocladiopsis]KAH7028057.1 hypothetical protein B0I36DRAFT_351495 [Microdochium trichocladiopsis]